MTRAIERDEAAHRALLGGDRAGAQSAFGEAAELYLRSWEQAPPASYGRLVGMLKSGVLAGAGRDQAQYVRTVFGETLPDSPTAAYARAIAALIEGDDAAALSCAVAMRGASAAFERAADGITALADHDQDAYRAAIESIAEDFAHRSEHLTGVAIADTALMLQELAAARGMRVEHESPVLPPAGP
jgi:hypothetical protein